MGFRIHLCFMTCLTILLVAVSCNFNSLDEQIEKANAKQPDYIIFYESKNMPQAESDSESIAVFSDDDSSIKPVSPLVYIITSRSNYTKRDLL